MLYVIVLKKHYYKFDYKNIDCQEIDAYYITSNYLYHFSRSLQSKLINFGKISETDYHFGLLAYVSGLGLFRGDNNLLYDEIGSRFGLQCFCFECTLEKNELTNAIKKIMGDICITVACNFPKTEIEISVFEFEKILNYKSKKFSQCANCNLCTVSCPQKAIGSKDLCFKCLRYFMDQKVVDTEIIKKFGNKIMGCDICQSVCPYNKNEKVIVPPKDFVESILSKDKKRLGYYVGKNLCNKILFNIDRVKSINTRESSQD